MSKKNHTGLLIALGAVLGAAAAGVSYYLKYKSFNDEIEKDFHDYEEDTTEETADETFSISDTNRTYISIDSNKAKATEDVSEEVAEEIPAAEIPVVEEEVVNEAPVATVEEDTEGAN